MSQIGMSQNLFTTNYPSNENYRVERVKQDYDGNFVLSGYRDIIAENAARPYVFKVSATGQVLDSVIYFMGMPYDWFIADVIIDSSFYYFIGFSGDWSGNGTGPNDSSMFLLKTDYSLIPIDTHFYPVVDNQDIGYSTSKFDDYGNIIVTGYYSTQNSHFGSFINKLNKNGNLLNSSIVTADSNKRFTNIMIDSSFYYAFGYTWSNILPRLIYKYDSSLNLIDTYVIPNKAQQYYSPIKISSHKYFTSGYIHSSTYPSTKKFAIIKSTIDGILIDSLEFGKADSTNIPAFYDALCIQNGYLYFAGSIYKSNTIPPYGENIPSYLYISKIDTSLNIIWEKLIGGDAYYTAMNVIATLDGGILMMGSRNILNDNKNNLDIRLVKLDTNGNITWIKNIETAETDIKLFPNPATDDLIISLLDKTKKIKFIRIFDTQQREILSKQVDSQETKVDISNYSIGFYLIEGVLESGERFVGKFVKE